MQNFDIIVLLIVEELMNTSYYKPVGAHELAVADLIQMNPSRMLITRINVPAKYRGSGVGSQLLSEICSAADTDHIELILEVMSSGDLSDEELVDWYSRYGFKVKFNKDYGSVIMQRHPVN